MSDNTRYFPFVGRVLIGAIFLMSGLGKLAAYGATTAMIAAAGLPVPPAAWLVAVVVEAGGGLLLLLGASDHVERVCAAQHLDVVDSPDRLGVAGGGQSDMHGRMVQFAPHQAVEAQASCVVLWLSLTVRGRMAAAPP